MSYLKANDVTDVKTFLGGWRDGGSVESTGCSFRGSRLCSQYPHNNSQHLQPRFLRVQHPLFVSKDMHVYGTYVQKLTHTPEMKINLKQLLDSVMAERAPHTISITSWGTLRNDSQCLFYFALNIYIMKISQAFTCFWKQDVNACMPLHTIFVTRKRKHHSLCDRRLFPGILPLDVPIFCSVNETIASLIVSTCELKL